MAIKFPPTQKDRNFLDHNGRKDNELGISSTQKPNTILCAPSPDQNTTKFIVVKQLKRYGILWP